MRRERYQVPNRAPTGNFDCQRLGHTESNRTSHGAAPNDAGKVFRECCRLWWRGFLNSRGRRPWQGLRDPPSHFALCNLIFFSSLVHSIHAESLHSLCGALVRSRSGQTRWCRFSVLSVAFTDAEVILSLSMLFPWLLVCCP